MITLAYAQSASALGGSDMLIQIVPFVLIFIIMYFLMIRPQQKRQKEHQEMINILLVLRIFQLVKWLLILISIQRITDRWFYM